MTVCRRQNRSTVSAARTGVFSKILELRWARPPIRRRSGLADDLRGKLVVGQLLRGEDIELIARRPHRMNPSLGIDAHLDEMILHLGADRLAMGEPVIDVAWGGGGRVDLMHTDPGALAGNTALSAGENDRARGGAIAIIRHDRVDA